MTDDVPTQGSNGQLARDVATVTLLGELRALHAGASIGLLLAVPAVSLYPLKFNALNTAPLVCVAGMVGKAGLLSATLALPMKAYRLATATREQIGEHAIVLRSNDKVKKLGKLGTTGAIVGLILQSIRAKEIAKLNSLPISTIVTHPRFCWETFCLALLGSTVAINVPILGHVITCKIKKLINKNKNNPIDQDDEKTLVSDANELNDQQSEETPVQQIAEETETAVKESVDEMMQQAADSAETADKPNGTA